MKTSITRLMTLLLTLGVAGSALPEGVLLYDVDFDSSPHVVGQAPEADIDSEIRTGPSRVLKGDPTVVDAVGAMEDRPCAFGNGTDGYDQLEFVVAKDYGWLGFGVAFRRYRVELDLLVEQLGVPLGESPQPFSNALTLLLDSPTVRSIQFGFDGSIRSYPPMYDSRYSLRRVLHVVIEVDVAQDRWRLEVDGDVLWNESMEFEELRSFRVNLPGTHAEDSAAIDNLKIVGLGLVAVPTQSTSWSRLKASYR